MSHIDSMSDPVTDLEINCTSQLRLLKAVRRSNPEARVVYAGTRQVYGRPLYLPLDEKRMPSVPLREGLAETVAYCRRHKEHYL